jgi:hypothetical protein
METAISRAKISLKHRVYAIEYAKSTSVSKTYLMTNDMSKADLSKIDILFLATGRKPVFHTELWLRKLYGCNRNIKMPFHLPEGSVPLPGISCNILDRL